jgi:hypothetical protein
MSTLLYPIANSTVQLTPSAGTNYTCVDEVVLDATDYNWVIGTSDTTYVVAFDEFEIGNTTSDEPISGVTVSAYAAVENLTYGNAKIKFHVNIGSVKYYSSEYSMSGYASTFTYTWLLNPATTAVWAKAEINAPLIVGYTISVRGHYEVPPTK